MPSALAPLYDLQRNPPYQINYRSKRAGKHITATKRRITFQFGFSSAEAIASGDTEANCRGEEHEIVLIWSHVSGKRELFMDGKPIHASKAARGNTKFQYTWGIGTHVLKIIANGTPPMGENSHMRQFDLLLDGISFFRFFRIYQLGRNQVKGLSKPQTKDHYSRGPSKEYSFRGTGYAVSDDISDYDDEEDSSRDVVSSVPSSVEVQSKTMDLFETPSLMTAPTLSITSSASSFSYDEFSPVNSPINSKPAFDSNLIMSAYNGTSNVAQLPSQDESRSDVNSRALVPVSEDQIDVITKSMKNIVNLDDINSTPFQPVSQSLVSSNTKKSTSGSWGLVGRQPTLAEQQQMKSQMTSAQQQQPTQSQQPYGQAPPLQNQPYGYYANDNAQQAYTYARAY
eukprot:CAMPEP_0201713308 /NCGR_PEP_ID=MMETSP0593-20130828/194_1 /ASSEMBLY_ACC=CAM_ASM_000672 /TAXON_ID=267983 /ORGANISM="Skeletonema japonicum, Strain CCMP2506" /LENGTH=397 /DNA_ID=CAMNT_0048202441 /DNA_START=96 /DNA_END=1289 /DNA_ORIENTATION=+